MKFIFFLVALILLINFTYAQTDINPADFISDLISSLMEQAQAFFTGMLSGSLQPLINLIRELLVMPINLELFIGLWKIIIYILSFFYGLIFLYNGVDFIISSSNPERREKAKSFLKNSILMIFFINGSYIFYKFLVEFSSLLSDAASRLIDPKIFLIEFNFADAGFQISYLILFLMISFLTLIVLGIRYLLVSFGLVIFPLGILFYFIPYTKSLGKFMIESLIVAIFIPPLDALLLAGTSKLLEIQFFSNFSILALTIGISLISLTTIAIAAFAFMRSITPLISNNSSTIHHK